MTIQKIDNSSIFASSSQKLPDAVSRSTYSDNPIKSQREDFLRASPTVKQEIFDSTEIARAMKKAEQVAQAFDRMLRFRFREESGGFQVEVLELKGNEESVIRKIPPDQVINFIEHVRDMFGALIDVDA